MITPEQNTCDVSKRINVTLPDLIAEALDRWADSEGRPTANLAAYLLETAIKEAEERGKIPPIAVESRST